MASERLTHAIARWAKRREFVDLASGPTISRGHKGTEMLDKSIGPFTPRRFPESRELRTGELIS
ncbi:MAG: hypothetical protein ACKN9U_26130, partial [Pirellulaceae bacterium]